MADHIQKQINRLNQEIDQLRQQKNYKKAFQLASQVRDIALRSYGATHSRFSEALHSLALLYWEVGDQASAEPLLKQELVI